MKLNWFNYLWRFQTIVICSHRLNKIIKTNQLVYDTRLILFLFWLDVLLLTQYRYEDWCSPKVLPKWSWYVGFWKYLFVYFLTTTLRTVGHFDQFDWHESLSKNSVGKQILIFSETILTISLVFIELRRTKEIRNLTNQSHRF